MSGASGVTVQLTGATIDLATTNASGAYSFSGVTTGVYTLAPMLTGYVFTPSSLAKRVMSASPGTANFAASATTAPTYSITGTVSGAAAAGVVITLNGANVGSAATDQSGGYGFFGLTSGTYSVSASLSSFSFSPAEVITIGAANATSNDFTSTQTPSGTITFVVPNPLPQATVGVAYSNSVITSIAGGTAPYHYQTDTQSNGTPPVGMVLNPNGTLTGTPSQAGQYAFNVCAVDAAGETTTPCEATSITVAAAPAQTTPPPASGTSWVYYNGTYDWPLDYSFDVNVDYADTSGAPLSGPHDIKVTLTSAWGGWLPIAQNWDFNSAPYTKLTFALKPTVANQKWDVYFVRVGDVPVGIYIDPTQYGPAPVVGKWATYTIPLSALGVQGDPIYKFCIHDETGLGSNTWYVDNVGFAP